MHFCYLIENKGQYNSDNFAKLLPMNLSFYFETYIFLHVCYVAESKIKIWRRQFKQCCQITSNKFFLLVWIILFLAFLLYYWKKVKIWWRQFKQCCQITCFDEFILLFSNTLILTYLLRDWKQGQGMAKTIQTMVPNYFSWIFNFLLKHTFKFNCAYNKDWFFIYKKYLNMPTIIVISYRFVRIFYVVIEGRCSLILSDIGWIVEM